MISDKEGKIDKNKICDVLGVGLNVRWCGQGRKPCAHLRQGHSGQRKQMP